MISGIQHFAFCRRQWALIHVEKQWEENFLTAHGQMIHKRADNPEIIEKRHDIVSIHSMHVRSERLKIEGICDIVELHQNENGVYFPHWKDKFTIYPLEYKRGKERTDHSHILQLTAQAICLEEMTASTIPEGAIYYFSSRQRVKVLFTPDLRKEVEQMVEEMHEYMEKGYTPKVKQKPKCRSCSMKELCLPELGNRKSASSYLKEMLEEDL